ncbi:MAG: hypothetical protein A3I07_03665 [Candidatus Doudnabacteria bacterium RIFCSPLOWO2_02_FULL_42_9]|uniref:Uncharacterized protein n=1 Tax=Candidatus Doudnabacteria bacterium RIFCSPHIGHO2_01_FULL_41_86 TaxID=1817821 RepID=A0A1F5N9I3_9BACT|nr:MAG: hypothetical protein A2717_02365 [Candidatus Doudnabacteria bacterium RIFCSPHIGHO2_01_FULL_41_86]OGE75605.1 MAG: hypothetical protein A3K07_02125 [Candidatus Doudnabacteria bacterium RIFCSPHIGHO2_01_43_10]OGE85400.1 MAG: hypothetical protein A3E28_01935 [Candidatus Doudnabacteria bacterium RIFCSPHIGHO2_12_FULL_42_22]OGE86938.1 MAG: hypothetical protein A3C49_02770 [Candidatus Doudnabacteria bacterium RIFCSPHIGHO2_02_FULL_42_25]OGE92537.1 MAG: hypothetical protein A2895_02925 [Candidatus
MRHTDAKRNLATLSLPFQDEPKTDGSTDDQAQSGGWRIEKICSGYPGRKTKNYKPRETLSLLKLSNFFQKL